MCARSTSISKGFEALGAKVTLPKGGLSARRLPEEGLHGAHIYFDVVSVGATMNIMLAAVLAKGQTIMENCAKSRISSIWRTSSTRWGQTSRGAGTDVIKIRGVERLQGGSYSIIPDQIEAGTFMAAVAACGGSVLVKTLSPSIWSASPPSSRRWAWRSRNSTIRCWCGGRTA